MSNFIHGKIIINQAPKVIDSKIDLLMIEFSKSNGFGLHIEKASLGNNDCCDLKFKISDHLRVEYCERFLEPIIYTEYGRPIIGRLIKDLDILKGLISLIFEFDFVERVELGFTYNESGAYDCDICEISFEDMCQKILEAYLSDTDLPQIKFIIKR